MARRVDGRAGAHDEGEYNGGFPMTTTTWANSLDADTRERVIETLLDYGLGIRSDSSTLWVTVKRFDVVAVNCTNTPGMSTWLNGQRRFTPAVLGLTKPYELYRCAEHLEFTMGRGWVNRAARLGFRLFTAGAEISVPWAEAATISTWPAFELLPYFQPEWLL
jgi:hypothetical protein